MRNESRFIGVISDTHGLVRPQALRELEGARLICHAGDVGKPDVIASLEKIAPVIAIKGNNDRGGWAKRLPTTAIAEIESFRIYLLHDFKKLSFDPAAKGFHAVISGHSHRPSVTEKAGVLFLNPGSAGPRRFNLPITVARLAIEGNSLSVVIIPLHV
ncbi:MAG: metallophosphoesterase family protein [Deltaproteobacteria bacterium]|nr:metallophosphoesterase family protein [Deltaproteobacteria bacterium]